MGKKGLRVKARLRLAKRKSRHLATDREEKAVIKTLQEMEQGDIRKVTLRGHTFLARLTGVGYEFSTNPELMEMIDKVGKAFDKAFPKFKSEKDLELWKAELPKWGTVEEPPKGIVKYGDSVEATVVTPKASVVPKELPPGVAEATVDIATYEAWMNTIRPKLVEELGLKWGTDINASVSIVGDKIVKVRWQAYTPIGEAYLSGLAESLARAQLPAPNAQLPGPSNEISHMH